MGKKRKHEDEVNDFSSNKKFKEENALLKDERDVLSSVFTLILDAFYYVYNISNNNSNSSDVKLELLKELGFSLEHYQTFYQEISEVYPFYIDSPFRIKELAKIIKFLQGSGFSFEQHQPLYKKIINSPSRIKELSQMFKSLEETGFIFEYHQLLPPMVINLINSPFYLSYSDRELQENIKAFKDLQEAGFSIEHHQVLYKAIINKHNYISVLVSAFKALKKAGFSFEHYQVLYQAVINEPWKANVPLAIKALQEAAFSYEHHAALFMAVNKNQWRAYGLAQAFISLKKGGFDFSLVNKGYGVYSLFINEPVYFTQLAEAFISLSKAGFDYFDNFEMYEPVINEPWKADVPQAIKALQEAGFSLEHHQPLYQAVSNSPWKADGLVQAFKALRQAGISFEHHQEFYQVKPEYIEKMIEAFKTLHELGFSFEHHQTLYQVIINQPKNTQKLNEALKALLEAGISFEYLHAFLYQAIINNHPFYIEEFAKAIIALQESGFSIEQHETFYQKVGNKLKSAMELRKVFEALHKVGFSFEHHQSFYHNVIDMPEAALVLLFEVLTALEKMGFNSQDHAFLFNNLFNKLTESPSNRILVFKIIENIRKYTKCYPLLKPQDMGFNAQTDVLEAHLNAEMLFAEGPLNKSSITKEIESILQTLSSQQLSDIELYFDERWENYILKMSNLPAINLSLLLRSANLSQLELSNELISLLDKIIDAAYSGWNYAQNHFADYEIIEGKENEFLETSQKALRLYTTGLHKNINRFFRGEKLDDQNSARFTFENIGKRNDKDPLICFLLGCLINNTINQLVYLIKGVQEENILLDRGEFLTEEIINARLANPWHFPAVTSFSKNKFGSVFFRDPDTIRTKLENPPAILPIVNSREGEVLFSQGHQVITMRGDQGFIVRLVNSPSLERQNTVWSELALQNALENYLSKEYRDEMSGIDLEGKTIYRPNHNLTHVYRVMNAIEFVLSYFSRHAKDDEFRKFSEECTAQEMEWLRVAAAFSITGRESEISAGENLKKYDEYRAASAGHFLEFVNSSQDVKDPNVKEMAECMFNVVRFMGNPEYEQSKDGRIGINKEENIEKRQRKNFYYRILTIAHKLDLTRCYSAEQYQQSMQLCLDLSLDNDAQRADYLEMVQYNIELTKAHGAHLSCDLDIHGAFINVQVPYKAIYARASSTLQQLYEISKTVTEPSVSRSEMKVV